MEHEQIFTLDQAKSLLPWLQEVTVEAETKVLDVQQAGLPPNEARPKVLKIIHHWAETIAKLGALPKQPFTVDFNSGDDYYCWEYPETDITHRHDYDKGYAGRRKIEDES